MEKNQAGVRIIEGWEPLVMDTASKVMEQKLIVRNRAVEWCDGEMKEARVNVPIGALRNSTN